MYTMKATCVQKKEKPLQNRKPERPTEKWQKLGVYLLEQTHLLAKGTYLPGGGYRNMQDVKIKHNSDQSEHLNWRLALSKLGVDGPYISPSPKPRPLHPLSSVLFFFINTFSSLLESYRRGSPEWVGFILFSKSKGKSRGRCQAIFPS